MKNVPFPWKKEYRGTTLKSPCDVIGDVITMENTFSCIIWGDLFISDVDLKLYLIFDILKIVAVLRSQQTLLLQVISKVQYASKIAMSI